MLRATRNSDEARNPFEKRRPVRSTARRLARGFRCVEKSVGRRPGKKTSNRPAIAPPEGGPHAEPAEPQGKFVLLNSDLSAHARRVQSTASARPPPQCIVDVLKGKKVSLPPYPLCALGLGRGDLEILCGSAHCAD